MRLQSDFLIDHIILKWMGKELPNSSWLLIDSLVKQNWNGIMVG